MIKKGDRFLKVDGVDNDRVVEVEILEVSPSGKYVKYDVLGGTLRWNTMEDFIAWKTLEALK